MLFDEVWDGASTNNGLQCEVCRQPLSSVDEFIEDEEYDVAVCSVSCLDLFRDQQ